MFDAYLHDEVLRLLTEPSCKLRLLVEVYMLHWDPDVGSSVRVFHQPDDDIRNAYLRLNSDKFDPKLPKITIFI